MTRQQAEDIVKHIGVGVEVREHPKAKSGAAYYSAVCGKEDGATLTSARRLCQKANHAYSVETAPAWASDCAWAIY